MNIWWIIVNGIPNVNKDFHRVICSPYEPAREEGSNQCDTIIQLNFRASQIQLVAEPVDVEEWGGQFPENKGCAIVVYEGALVPG